MFVEGDITQFSVYQDRVKALQNWKIPGKVLEFSLTKEEEPCLPVILSFPFLENCVDFIKNG